ncbi:MAG: hypothetical protein WA667_26305 [Candidatus Nitrosopolaris sp.]
MRGKSAKINDKRFNTSKTTKNNIYDVVIIGAGFAGLSAALVLGRYLRPAVIFDAGKMRNDNTKHVRSYLGLENMSPRKFIKKAWKDVLQYHSLHVINLVNLVVAFTQIGNNSVYLHQLHFLASFLYISWI